jgi:hypothetical protein
MFEKVFVNIFSFTPSDLTEGKPFWAISTLFEFDFSVLSDSELLHDSNKNVVNAINKYLLLM